MSRMTQTSPPASAPARHRFVAAAATLLAVGLAAGCSTAVGSSTGADASRREAAKAAPKVMAPRDGDLRVGTVTVAQMPGACDGSSCYHVPPAQPVLVKAGSSAKLAMKAGQSTLFSVGAFNEKRRNAAVPITVRGSDLVLEQMAPGTYLVTVAGRPNGGMWQFRLKVSAAAR